MRVDAVGVRSCQRRRRRTDGRSGERTELRKTNVLIKKRIYGGVLSFCSQLESSSVVSLTAGLWGVAIVLPAATFMSFMFRFCGMKVTGSGVGPTAEKDSEGQV